MPFWIPEQPSPMPKNAFSQVVIGITWIADGWPWPLYWISLSSQMELQVVTAQQKLETVLVKWAFRIKSVRRIV